MAPLCSFGQVATNKAFNTNIRTVQLHKEGWAHSYPILTLNKNENLELSFDELDSDTKSYNYSIELCDANWEPSLLMESEYIIGNNQNPVLDYQFSFNTSIDYVHYNLKFPNDDFKIRYSGNYIIKIYEDFDVEHPVLTWRFMVVEQRVDIFPQVKYAVNAELRKAMQEISVTVQHPNFGISNPLQEVKMTIMQNQRSDNALENIQPQFIKNNELVYNYNRELMFEGGNEYRWLDIRSIRFQSDRIKDITFHDPFYHVEMVPDPILYDASYFFRNDFNGRYVVEVQEDRDPELEADYVMVHFNMPRSEPMVGGDIYVIGGLSNWEMNENSKMTYNFMTKTYELRMMLKQGFYNYMFAYKANDSRSATVAPFEGSHGQTENDYLIIMYYRGIGDNYDRIVGVRQTNSLKPSVN